MKASGTASNGAYVSHCRMASYCIRHTFDDNADIPELEDALDRVR